MWQSWGAKQVVWFQSVYEHPTLSTHYAPAQGEAPWERQTEQDQGVPAALAEAQGTEGRNMCWL